MNNEIAPSLFDVFTSFDLAPLTGARHRTC